MFWTRVMVNRLGSDDVMEHVATAIDIYAKNGRIGASETMYCQSGLDKDGNAPSHLAIMGYIIGSHVWWRSTDEEAVDNLAGESDGGPSARTRNRVLRLKRQRGSQAGRKQNVSYLDLFPHASRAGKTCPSVCCSSTNDTGREQTNAPYHRSDTAVA
ncbi:uncharacterized protein BCR38DRAFT_15084 [Pseudomassariella vexata]|uniref:Uncharacterized protein n=1 Tax=Pseudomassariella vexata TaxID=1141098 RepID=A0A1Y2EJ94_9PEZI|nr:uncharacterized protein BCR38DRAFT_15084 [Pseudomassariella vexata]ORY71638.1 hypothetical protein BCR38DRAFT_15084 [Pseudomassariella vexata]